MHIFYYFLLYARIFADSSSVLASTHSSELFLLLLSSVLSLSLSYRSLVHFVMYVR